MRRILTFALLAAFALAAAVPVSIATAGTAAADVATGKKNWSTYAHSSVRSAHRGR